MRTSKNSDTTWPQLLSIRLQLDVMWLDLENCRPKALQIPGFYQGLVECTAKSGRIFLSSPLAIAAASLLSGEKAQ